MHANIRIYGKWMYERQDVYDLFKLIEGGMLDLGVAEVTGEFANILLDGETLNDV